MMCFFSLTRGDGAVFVSASILERGRQTKIPRSGLVREGRHYFQSRRTRTPKGGAKTGRSSRAGRGYPAGVLMCCRSDHAVKGTLAPGWFGGGGTVARGRKTTKNSQPAGNPGSFLPNSSWALIDHPGPGGKGRPKTLQPKRGGPGRTFENLSGPLGDQGAKGGEIHKKNASVVAGRRLGGGRDNPHQPSIVRGRQGKKKGGRRAIKPGGGVPDQGNHFLVWAPERGGAFKISGLNRISFFRDT